MRKVKFYLVAGIMIIVAGTLISKENMSKKLPPVTNDNPLPAMLDNFYPPKAQGPVYLFRMHELGLPFSGIVVDFFENDIANTRNNFKKFKEKYIEISKMIPEWVEYFPMNPLNDLELALKKGDPGLIMPAYEKVGKVCGDCHYAYMPAVQFKYHWPDFGGITVTDPLTKEEISFSRLMQFLEANFNGITINVEQKQIDNAKRQLFALKERFDVLEESCMTCHDTERHYYVDQGVKNMIADIEKALNASPVDQSLLSSSAQGIGMENCYKCHLVHVPAAAAQMQMHKE